MSSDPTDFSSESEKEQPLSELEQANADVLSMQGLIEEWLALRKKMISNKVEPGLDDSIQNEYDNLIAKTKEMLGDSFQENDDHQITVEKLHGKIKEAEALRQSLLTREKKSIFESLSEAKNHSTALPTAVSATDPKDDPVQDQTTRSEFSETSKPGAVFESELLTQIKQQQHALKRIPKNSDRNEIHRNQESLEPLKSLLTKAIHKRRLVINSSKTAATTDSSTPKTPFVKRKIPIKSSDPKNPDLLTLPPENEKMISSMRGKIFEIRKSFEDPSHIDDEKLIKLRQELTNINKEINVSKEKLIDSEKIFRQALLKKEETFNQKIARMHEMGKLIEQLDERKSQLIKKFNQNKKSSEQKIPPTAQTTSPTPIAGALTKQPTPPLEMPDLPGIEELLIKPNPEFLLATEPAIENNSNILRTNNSEPIQSFELIWDLIQKTEVYQEINKPFLERNIDPKQPFYGIKYVPFEKQIVELYNKLSKKDQEKFEKEFEKLLNSAIDGLKKHFANRNKKIPDGRLNALNDSFTWWGKKMFSLAIGLAFKNSDFITHALKPAYEKLKGMKIEHLESPLALADTGIQRTTITNNSEIAQTGSTISESQKIPPTFHTTQQNSNLGQLEYKYRPQFLIDPLGKEPLKPKKDALQPIQKQIQIRQRNETITWFMGNHPLTPNAIEQLKAQLPKKQRLALEGKIKETFSQGGRNQPIYLTFNILVINTRDPNPSRIITDVTKKEKEGGGRRGGKSGSNGGQAGGPSREGSALNLTSNVLGSDPAPGSVPVPPAAAAVAAINANPGSKKPGVPTPPADDPAIEVGVSRNQADPDKPVPSTTHSLDSANRLSAITEKGWKDKNYGIQDNNIGKFLEHKAEKAEDKSNVKTKRHQDKVAKSDYKSSHSIKGDEAAHKGQLEVQKSYSEGTKVVAERTADSQTIYHVRQEKTGADGKSEAIPHSDFTVKPCSDSSSNRVVLSVKLSDLKHSAEGNLVTKFLDYVESIAKNMAGTGPAKINLDKLHDPGIALAMIMFTESLSSKHGASKVVVQLGNDLSESVKEIKACIDKIKAKQELTPQEAKTFKAAVDSLQPNVQSFIKSELKTLMEPGKAEALLPKSDPGLDARTSDIEKKRPI
ncbi:MAG: hypothetical protein ACKOAD_00805 [Gammaproteobacteria bacterium]